MVGKETVGICEMIDDGDTADVNDELNETGLVGNDLETSGGKEADNGGGGYAESGKELSGVHAFTGGIIALGKAMLLVVVGTGTDTAGDKLGD